MPRKPLVCQVSSTSISVFGNAATYNALSCTNPAKSQSQCGIPLQNGQRPETTYPPSTLRPVPRGAQTPAATVRGSPKTSSAHFRGA